MKTKSVTILGPFHDPSMLFVASALTIMLWIIYYPVASLAASEPMVRSPLLGFFSNALVLLPLTASVLCAMFFICVSLFYAKENRWRFWAASLLAVVSLILPFGSRYSPFAANDDHFQLFVDGIKRNQNLNQVVFWSRELLLKDLGTNDSIAIPNQLIPNEAKTLLPKQEMNPILRVRVYRSLVGNQRCAVVSYDFRDLEYGLVIGDTNFSMPAGRVKNLEKYENGVFLFDDW